MKIRTDLKILINVFPNEIKKALNNNLKKHGLIEIIIDLGRRPEAQFSSGTHYISVKPTSWQDIDYITKRIGKFSDDNRAGIVHTLHRISCIRNKQGTVVGLTCRVGRSLIGTITIIRDLLQLNRSLLILGKPGVGKTTTIREISRVLSDEMGKRVVIVDSSNEIGGSSDTLHPGIGKSRRMQVSFQTNQHDIMIEAIENHTPEVIIVDEIGTALEALAARTIAERGVQLIGTAHGNCLENLVKNPTLMDLVGGIETVTLSDEEAKRRKIKKSILERKALPVFQIAIEINEKTCWIIHEELSRSIDKFLLLGKNSNSQVRSIKYNGTNKIWKIHTSGNPEDLPPSIFFQTSKISSYFYRSKIAERSRLISLKNLRNKNVFICSYLISLTKLERIIKKSSLDVKITINLKRADVFITLDHFAKNISCLTSEDNFNKCLVYGLRENSSRCIRKGLHVAFGRV